MEKWWKKLWKLMFGDDDEEDEGSERQSIRPRRFPIAEHENNVKVIHEYPKGNFRFPLIPDEEKAQTDEKSFHTHRKMPSQQGKEKFGGKDFKVSSVPSPIFGFGERHTFEPLSTNEKQANEEMSDPTIHEVNDEEASHENLQPIIQKAEPVDEEKAERNNVQLTAEKDSVEMNEELKTEENTAHGLEEKEMQNVTPLRNSQVQNELPKANASKIGQSVPVQIHPAPVPYNVMMFKADRNRNYYFPKLQLLDSPIRKKEDSFPWLEEQKKLLNETFKNFNVNAVVVNAVKGPSVTRFEVQPSPGVKVSKITNLSDDIKLSLSAKEIRIEAPIPGRNAIGIEVPNRSSQPVGLRDILESQAFQKHSSPLAAALGVDISGAPVVTDLRKMPHGLIAGATGSGKSVCINAILASLLYKANPDDVKFMLIDPKVVELAPYNELPHLVTPVVTDVKDATLALKWAVEEMELRYKKFAKLKVRDIDRYNESIKKNKNNEEKMPYIVIIIDELADLMMVSPQEVEDAICRIAQKARACGIHLLVATQRPSVDVITGLIKANIPTRIAFSVSSQVDSRTILDASGAEKLLGKGDMLFMENGSPKPIRLQGNFVSDEEIERITEFIKKQRKPNYIIEMDELTSHSNDEHEDELFEEACEFIFEQGAASSSSLQRRFRIGYNRAARLIDMMEESGLVSKANGSKPRKLLMTKQEFLERMSKQA